MRSDLTYPRAPAHSSHDRTIFNLGAVLGSAIQLGLTWSDSTETVDVSSTVYAVFVAISALGVILPIFLINPGRLVRTDGSRVVLPLRPSESLRLRRDDRG